MLLLGTIVGLLFVASTTSSAVEPKEYNIPLAKLSVSLEEYTNEIQSVRIYFPENQKESYIITPFNDTHVKETQNGREQTLFRESDDKAFGLSDFEAEQLNKICQTLTATISEYEQDLQSRAFDRCLYLDAFFPRFLKGFWYLYNTTRCSRSFLSTSGLVPDSAFEVALNSPKSRARIQRWQASPEYVTKLRIVSKELIYQMNEWQKRELTNKNRKPEAPLGGKFETAFTVFVRVYFDLKPSPKIPMENEHL